MTVHRRNPKQPETPLSSSSTLKDPDRKQSRSSSRRKPLCFAFLVATVFGIVILLANDNGKSFQLMLRQTGASSPSSSSQLLGNQSRSDLFAQLENCALPPAPPSRTVWSTKPLLVPGYPSSYSEAKGPGDIMQPMIRHLTGLRQGARNFHASSKGLKRCHMTNVETVTCSQVHPIISISPEKHTKLFDSNVILAIQSFQWAFPMGFSIKANRYNNVEGQAGKEEWRKARGQYLEEAFEKWKSVITTWKTKNQYYKIAMYLPFEHMMDPIKGPELVHRLSKKLQSVGFVVVRVDESNRQCIWMHSIRDAVKFEQDYVKYIPAYTFKQRDYLLEQMKSLIKEMSDDTELVGILSEYHDEIRDFLPIEEDEV